MGDPEEVDDGSDWQDQRSRYDSLRAQCPVARVDGAWVVLGHAEVVAVATDPVAYSSAVTSRRAIPNSLDGPEHAAYREIVDRYMTAERVALQEPVCREIAAAIVNDLVRGETVMTIASIGVPFAVRAQCAWLGWPTDLEDDLVGWMKANHAATRSGDRQLMAEVAERFDAMIRELVAARQGRPATDVTGELMRDAVHGRPLTDAEIVSILRNWTAGDLGSLATSVGVIVHFLAADSGVQDEVRSLVAAGEVAAVEAAVGEMLRIDDPFVSNRRRATRALQLGTHAIHEDGRVLLNWTAANRDPLVFGDPDHYDPAGHADANLVFGIGPHKCPGRALSLMELRVITEELLTRTSRIDLSTESQPVRETPPVGGWARVPVVLR